jgi:1,4-dihydroxy-2-naphthoyl-CoA synthase
LDYQSEQAEAIDLTEAIAEHFHPDEATLRAMRELMKQDPVPIEKLK